MKEFSFTARRSKQIEPQTLAAIGEMLKVATENIEKIVMRVKCKECGKTKPLMKKLGMCNDCFLSKHKLTKTENGLVTLKPRNEPPPAEEAA